ncbi:DUF2268 domain-containing putative Zn-dependent protease [Sphingoaurantiacus capsulatus]|uniref:DUF2268 domain-containing putative Zn-dependent protease n=1 Tax=Sphingoaurantiacus capsulatus TaxID=1771310 RepID=A0ABV7XES2_9SPHN
MARLLLPIAAAALLASPAVARTPDIRTEDVERFYALYDAAGGKPTAEVLQRDYLDKGTPGLKEFARLRRITGERIAAAIAQTPKVYTDARDCAALLPKITARLSASLTRLGEIYPEASFPPVTLTIGRSRPVGVANATGVYIGLEALCAWEMPDPDRENRFVHVIAHEFVHVQQPGAQVEDDKASVLHASLLEGGAELIGELMSGSLSYKHLLTATRGREKEFETAFLADIDKPAMGSNWLYNGLGTPENPTDLGYWIGYRIAKAYYAKAQDKRAAVKAIIEMKDPKAFLAASGWTPGMRF